MTAGGYFSGVNFWVTQPAAGTGETPQLYGHSAPAEPAPGAPPGGEGFTLDLEQAQEMLTIAGRAQAALGNMLKNADLLKEMNPPASDSASVEYNSLLTWRDGPGAFSYGSGHVKEEYDYISTLIIRLEEALGIKRDTEKDVSKTIDRTANEGEPIG